MTTRMFWPLIVAAISPFVLLACLFAAVPRTVELPRDKPLPTETKRGFIQPIVDGWTKTFVLASEPSANWGGYPLSFTTKEMYGAFERNEGMLAEVELIRASRGHEECFVVVSFKVLE
jgi:hypothetical protein